MEIFKSSDKDSKNSKETKALPEVRVESCVETALEVSMKVIKWDSMSNH